MFIENEFPSLLENYGKQFDLVLIDSALVNLVADTATLLREDLPVLFVMGAGVTTEPEIERAIQIFENLQVKISGAIISRLDEGLASQDYNSYYESYFS